MGVILHLATGRHISRKFWDPRSASISLLEEKGVSERFVFGYDWHWRSEETYLDKSDCPVRKWPRSLKALHDGVSTEILEVLGLPFLITASSCTRENLAKTLSQTSRHLAFPVFPATGLKFHLDFRHGALCRLILHVYHPSSGFTSATMKRACIAAQIDAGLNFFLWLIGRGYDHDSFRRVYSQAGPPGKRSAPLAEMYAYLGREREEQRILEVIEYTPSFLSWAQRYLIEDPIAIRSRGDSIASVSLSKMRLKMSIARCKNAASHRKEGSKTKNMWTERNHFPSGQFLFHGKEVVMLQSGAVKLAFPDGDFNLTFRMASQKVKSIMALQQKPRIYFDACEVVLKVDGLDVYRKPIERLLTSANASEWIIQITHELDAIKRNIGMENDLVPSSAESKLALIPGDRRLGSRWKNGELQRKLLQGSKFSCTEISNSAKVGRIYIRGLQLYVPQEVDTVFVKCELAAEGSQHSNECPTLTEPDDPAKRLGIKIRYKVKETNEERTYWARVAGDCNTKILNSLVDFLENRDEKWTEQQPRRFLPRNVLKKRMQISYTS